MTFQPFQEIQDLLYQLKPECFTCLFQNKLYYSALTELADPDNEKQPMTGHFEQKPGLAKLRLLFYSAVVSKIFYLTAYLPPPKRLCFW